MTGPRPPKLGPSHPLVRQLSLLNQAAQDNLKYAGCPRGTLRGRVVDVDDPEERGRVKCVLYETDPAIPQVSGAGEWSKERIGEEPDQTHWIDVCPAFKGKQPKGLIGKHVSISASYGQYQYAVLSDVICDPQNLADGKKLDMPNNSAMTRLPCYETGSLPPASKENVGCMVVECGGPLQSDWLCVCLQRNGEYYWVRHIDASHGHAGQNDSTERPDSDGDSMAPINNQTIWDYTFPTTAGEMNKQTAYGTNPRGNPFGGQANWIGPAT
jgi:hypothetical protein